LLPDTAALVAERDEYLGALQRMKADFDNYRKRIVRQQEEQSARAAQALVAKLLPVLDTLDLAQAHLSSPGLEGPGPAGQTPRPTGANPQPTVGGRPGSPTESPTTIRTSGSPSHGGQATHAARPPDGSAGLHRAVQQAQPSAEEPELELTALTQARAQLLDVLIKEGLERVDETDVPFDPAVHDAVAYAPAEPGEAGSLVDEVMRAGYRWRGQVVRPAMVRVRG
jgi:molecular chaperone GrpE (heat shock protein)